MRVPPIHRLAHSPSNDARALDGDAVDPAKGQIFLFLPLRNLKSYFRFLEGFVASELLKSQVHRGRRRELFYFRDQQGLEVDFIAPGKEGTMRLIEAKAGKTVMPRMADSMRSLASAFAKRQRRVDMTLVHEARDAGSSVSAVAKDVRALPWGEWVKTL